jgi:hypothetical protein
MATLEERTMNFRSSLFSGLLASALIAPGTVTAVTNVDTIADPQESSIANGYDIAKIDFTLEADDSLTVEIFHTVLPVMQMVMVIQMPAATLPL